MWGDKPSLWGEARDTEGIKAGGVTSSFSGRGSFEGVWGEASPVG